MQDYPLSSPRSHILTHVEVSCIPDDNGFATFQTLTAALHKIQVFWDAVLCCLLSSAFFLLLDPEDENAMLFRNNRNYPAIQLLIVTSQNT